MKKRWTGYVAAALTAGLAFGTVGTTYAAPTLAGAEQETAQAETQAATEAAQAETQAATEAAQPETQAATEAQTEKSIVNTTGFAKSEDPVNVFVSGDTEGEKVGTLSTNDKVEILDEIDENGWVKIRSGNVEGYAPAYQLATGEEADQYAEKAGYHYAKLSADYVNIRSDASEDAEVNDVVSKDSDVEIVDETDEWWKVVTSDGVYGYVSKNFATKETAYSTGETVQEQSEREEQEYVAYLETQGVYAASEEDTQYQETPAEETYAETPATEAAYTETPATEAAYTETPATEAAYTETTTYTQTTTVADPSSVTSQAEVDALYQQAMAAQEAAMHCTDAADAETKANASREAYAAYAAAAQAYESYVYSTTTQTTQTTPSETAATTTTTDTTAAYTDTTASTEAPQTEAPQTEAPQTEAPAVSSGSSTGAAAASYACQFVGNPYVYGGTSLTNGADCSGFTMAVYANFGVSLPHNAAAQSGCGTSVSIDSLQPGDLVFYGDGGIGHVAIYIGGGTVVHASNEETGIKYSAYNYRTPVAAVRVC